MPAPVIQDNINATRLMRYCEAHKNDICKVLSKEEEQALIQKLKDNPDELQKALIMHNIALVFNMATKFMSASRSFDELVQNGLYGLCYAAKKYETGQTKTKFATYAYNWIYKYCWWTYWNDTQNTRDFLNNAVSLNAAISEYASSSKSDSDNGDMGNYLENHLDPNQAGAIVDAETAMQNNAMKSIYDDLRKYILTDDFTDMDRIVFENSFVDNALSLRRISSDFDLPLKDVKSSYQKILDLMKKKLEERNINSMEDVY